MKRTLILLCCGMLLLVFSFLPPFAGRGKSQESRVIPKESKKIASLCSVLSELAVRKHFEDTKSGKIHILTLHNDDFDFRDYTDGKYLVESLPVTNPNDLEGYCRFVCDYNRFNLEKADSLVLEGNYKDAKTLLEILLHFDFCGLITPDLNGRISALEKIEKKEGTDQDFAKFKGPSGFGSLVDWARENSVEPTIVTNLLNVKIGRIGTNQ